ncbi:enoyl-CoA hydratase-related protein [soil metagenome]
MKPLDIPGLVVAVDGPIGRVMLDRPDKLNALSVDLLRGLVEAARWFDAQPGVKVVTVTGAGRAFSAGFDLDGFTDSRLPMRRIADLGRAMAEAVTDMSAVTVVGVHGRCVGGGLVLAASCDLRLAADNAVFSIPEVDLGIPLAWGGIPRLVREIGPALTKELVMTCREFSPAEAAAAGLVNRVVPAADLAGAVEELAGQLSTKSTLTLTATKSHVNAAAEDLVSSGSGRRDRDVLVSAVNDPESRASARAYLERLGRDKAR